MVTITFIIKDEDFKEIESHKWNIRDWNRVEKTFNYIRRKYGKPRDYVRSTSNDSSWVAE